MNHTSWIGGQQATLSQLLTIPKHDDIELKKLADLANVTPVELIKVAISEKLRAWLSNPDTIVQEVKNDLLLEKLYRR